MTESTDERRFGTFLGVYVPSFLTILSLVMYLRFGWVVGNVGLGYTCVIALLASSITCIAALSASAIATNMCVGAGGEYFMVAHSLGLEIGGAIGTGAWRRRGLRRFAAAAGRRSADDGVGTEWRGVRRETDLTRPIQIL